MTRAELVKLLEDNWKEDEEVTFVYFDDGSDCRTTVCHVEQHHRDIVEGHDEWLEYVNGERVWHTITQDELCEINRTRMYKGQTLTLQEIWNRHRWIDHHKITSDVKTCLMID